MKMTDWRWWLCLLVFLVGCTPEYNWREVEVADGRAKLAFPARVQTDQRAVSLGGNKLPFHLTSASVNDAVFAVGYMKLPDNMSEAEASQVVRDLVNSLAARTGKRAPDAAYDSKVFELEAVVAGRPSRMLARVLVHRGMVIQVVASGPSSVLSQEHANEFMRSLRLL